MWCSIHSQLTATCCHAAETGAFLQVQPCAALYKQDGDTVDVDASEGLQVKCMYGAHHYRVCFICTKYKEHGAQICDDWKFIQR